MQRIRYYYAPEGATYYLQPNVFFPIEQTLQFTPLDGVGELCTERRANDNRPRPAMVSGTDAHGSFEDFAGLTPYTGPVPIEDVPDCRVPTCVRFIARGFEVGPMSPILSLSAVIASDDPGVSDTPINYIGLVSFFAKGKLAFSFSPAIAFTGKSGWSLDALPKIGFSAVAKMATPEGKIAFFGQTKTPAEDGKKIAFLAAAPLRLLGGGAIVDFLGESANFTFTEGGGGGPTPGGDCDTAMVIDFETDYTFNIAYGTPGPEHWFKFAEPGTGMSGTHHVTFTVNSGGPGAMTFYLGDDCGGKMFQTTVVPPTDCANYTSVFATNGYLQVVATSPGTMNYTVRVGDGVC